MKVRKPNGNVQTRDDGIATIDPLKRFEEAAKRYLPHPLRLLFIAEAPPAFRVNRLFYFTGLRDGDTLFLEMMKVLYPAEIGYSEGIFRPGFSVKQIRLANKSYCESFRRMDIISSTRMSAPYPTGRVRRPRPLLCAARSRHSRGGYGVL